MTKISNYTNFPATLLIQKKYGFKITLMLGAISQAIAGALLMITYNVPMVILSGTFQIIGYTFLSTIIFSLWPIVSGKMDKNKIKTPLNSTISVSNILGNLAIILADTIAAAIISFSNYDSNLEVQSNYTLNTIRYCSPIIMIVLSAIMVAIILAIFKKKNSIDKNK